MASNLITPIDVDGTRLCCQPWLFGITPTVDVGIPGGEQNNLWNYYGQAVWGFTGSAGEGGYTANSPTASKNGDFMLKLISETTSTEVIPAGGRGGAGGFAFGICCARTITLRLAGNMRVLSPGQDDVTLYLNGAVQWTAGASTADGQAWYDAYGGPSPVTNPDSVYPYYEGIAGGPIWNLYDDGPAPEGAEIRYHEITLELPPRPCGNVLRIVGGLRTVFPATSDGSNWRAKIISLT